MRKTGLLSAALLLATSGVALSVHAQGTQSTTSPSASAPSSTTRTESTTTTTTTKDAQAGQTSAPASAGVNTSTNIQSFTGKINKKDNQFMLEDKAKSASYKLDDAVKADRFDGKNVKVMGTLDASTNMIHVQSIEEEKGKS